MKPYIFSRNKSAKNEIGWHQGGKNISYDFRCTKYEGALTSITEKPYY